MLTLLIQTLFMACNTEDGLETWRTFHIVRHDCTPQLLLGIQFPPGQGQISPKRGFLPYKNAGMRVAHLLPLLCLVAVEGCRQPVDL
jgi:hypothetical protein